MSTVCFSVPDDVKEAFNATFAGQNKSAVVADWFARPCSAPTQTSRTLGFRRGCLNHFGSIPRPLGRYSG